jgi:hypothetical protein
MREPGFESLSLRPGVIADETAAAAGALRRIQTVTLRAFAELTYHAHPTGIEWRLE